MPTVEERELLRERAYLEVRRLLLGSARPDDPFLSERKLAQRLGLGHTPVRSAIERLETEGFLTIRPQQGIALRELTPREITDHYELREALEPFVVRRIAGRLSPAQEAELRENLQAQRLTTQARDMPRVIELDSAFHLLFCQFLGNGEITRVLLRLRDQIHRVILRVSAHVPERVAHSYQEHCALAEAVLSGDGEHAAELVTAHLRAGREVIVPAGVGD